MKRGEYRPFAGGWKASGKKQGPGYYQKSSSATAELLERREEESSEEFGFAVEESGRGLRQMARGGMDLDELFAKRDLK